MSLKELGTFQGHMYYITIPRETEVVAKCISMRYIKDSLRVITAGMGHWVLLSKFELMVISPSVLIHLSNRIRSPFREIIGRRVPCFLPKIAFPHSIVKCYGHSKSTYKYIKEKRRLDH